MYEEKKGSSRTSAVAGAFLVTFLWSTSFILIKRFIQDIPAITFAGLRYSLAFLCLLPLFLKRGGAARLRLLSRKYRGSLVLLGIVMYTLTQGAQFLGLQLLSPVTVSFFYSFTPLCVALLGIPLLKETLSRRQWLGFFLYILALILYFYPLGSLSISRAGIIIALAGMLANACASILGRSVNRDTGLDALTVTTVSMGIGGFLLLSLGIVTEGVPRLQPLHWGVILYLAVVNTALAFTLWNRSLRILSAVSSSLINNTMLFQVMILSCVFLDERITASKAGAVVIAVIGILLVTKISKKLTN